MTQKIAEEGADKSRKHWGRNKKNGGNRQDRKLLSWLEIYVEPEKKNLVTALGQRNGSRELSCL